LSLSQSVTGIISKKPVLEVETGGDDEVVEKKKGKEKKSPLKSFFSKGKSEESVSKKKSKSKPQAL
jgi:hypothetical protein